MEFPEQDALASGTFQFIVEDKPVALHRALVSKCSEPLNNFISGSFLEGVNGQGRLSNVDYGTFSRFGWWLYTGHYPAAEATLRNGAPKPSGPPEDHEEWKAVVSCLGPADFLSQSATAQQEAPAVEGPGPEAESEAESEEGSVIVTEEEAVEEEERVYTTDWYKVERRRASFTLRKRFLSSGSGNKESVPSVLQPGINLNASEDYSLVLLSHAQLYVFADQWQIEQLKQRALEDLFQLLGQFIIWDECIADIVGLLRFAYENTVAETEENDYPNDPLRRMLLLYIECEMDSLVNKPVFKDLMVENREFLDDIMWCVSRRLETFNLRGSRLGSENPEQSSDEDTADA